MSVSDVEVHNSVLFCQAPKFLKVSSLCGPNPVLQRSQDDITVCGYQASYYYDTFKTGPAAIFTAIDPADHSLFRRLVSRAFSRKSILEFEPEIHEIAQEMSSLLQQQSRAGAPVDITKLFRSLALDFITRFTYGGSLNALKAPDMNEPLLEAFDQFATSNFLVCVFPVTRDLLNDRPVYDVANNSNTCHCYPVHDSCQNVPGNTQYEKGMFRYGLTEYSFTDIT